MNGGEKLHSKAFWSADEDLLLAKLVATHGPRNWSLIAKSFKKRIGKQCRERWHNHLDPNVRKDAWSPSEDRYILEQVAYLGTKWSVIAQSLPGRTDSAVKNRYHSHLKRVMSQTSISPDNTENHRDSPSSPTPPRSFLGDIPHALGTSLSTIPPSPSLSDSPPAGLSRSHSFSAPPRKHRRLSSDGSSSRVTSHVTLMPTPALKTPFFVLSAFQQRSGDACGMGMGMGAVVGAGACDNMSTDGQSVSGDKRAPTLYVNPEHLGQKDIQAKISVRDLMDIIRRSQSHETLDSSDNECIPGSSVECSIQFVADPANSAAPFATHRSQSEYNTYGVAVSDEDDDDDTASQPSEEEECVATDLRRRGRW